MWLLIKQTAPLYGLGARGWRWKLNKKERDTKRVNFLSKLNWISPVQRPLLAHPPKYNKLYECAFLLFCFFKLLTMGFSVIERNASHATLQTHTPTIHLNTPQVSTCLHKHTHWKSVTVERVWLSTVSVLHIYKTKTCVCVYVWRAVCQAFLFIRLMVTTGSSVFFCVCLVLHVLLAAKFQHHAGSVSFGHKDTLWGAGVS